MEVQGEVKTSLFPNPKSRDSARAVTIGTTGVYLLVVNYGKDANMNIAVRKQFR